MEQKPVNPNTEESDGPPRGVRPPRRSFWLLVLLVLLTLLIFSSQFATSVSIIKDYAFFEQQVRQGNVLEVEIGPKELTGKFKIPPTPPDEYDDNGRPVPKVEKLRKNFLVAIPTTEEGRNSLQRLLEEQKVSFSFRRSDQDATQSFWMIALLLLPIVMFVLIWYQFRKTRDQLVGGGFLSGFSRSPAKRYEGAKQVISFKDVAGLEGVKADLLEIVDFLKSPEKFQRLGDGSPRGFC